MKFAVAILAILSVASPLSALELPASGSGVLAKDIQYIFDLVPVDKMVPILMLYADNETGVHAAMQIMQSNEFKLFLQDVEAIPEVRDLMMYIQEAGLDIYTMKDKLTKILDLDHISPLEASAGAETIPELKNLLKYVQEPGVDKITLQTRLNDFLGLKRIVTLDGLQEAGCGGFTRIEDALRTFLTPQKYDERFDEKLQNSVVFRDFIHRCSKLDFKKIYSSIRSNEHYVKVVQQAQQADIFTVYCRGSYPLIMAAKVVLALAL